MSSTPRTDAKYAEVYAGDDYEAVEKLNAFAQELEKELNDANERIKMLEEAGDKLVEVAKWRDYTGHGQSPIKDWIKAKETKP